MKKHRLILLLIIALPAFALAQPCYQHFYDIGLEELEAEDFDAAINNFKAAQVCPDKPLENDIDKKIVEAQNGYILAITKARDEAIKAKEDAEKARDEAIAARKELEALTFISKGQDKELNELYREAIDLYSKAIKMFPDSMPYYEKRAPLYLHETIREFENAIRDYKLLIEKGEESKRADYFDKLAYAYEQTKQFDAASQSLEMAVANSDESDKEIYVQKLDWAATRQQAIRNEGLADNHRKLNQGLIDDHGLSNKDPKPDLIISGPVKISIVSKSNMCNLNGTGIRIAGQTYRLNSSNFIISNLKQGEYDYEVFGKSQCGLGTCNIRGRGKIKVVANSIYYLKVDERNMKVFTANSECKAILSSY